MRATNLWAVLGWILLLQLALWPLVASSRVSWGHWLIGGLGVAAGVVMGKIMRAEGAAEEESHRATEEQCLN